jgi:two-component sensor histidine kinase
MLLVDYEPTSLCPSEDRLLLDELTHRISNELTSAIGIVTAAAARSSAVEVKVALGRVRERLESWARVQLALQMPDTTHSLMHPLICANSATPWCARS